MSEDEFDELVEAAIESIPDGLASSLENVVFMVLDEPEPEQLARIGGSGATARGGELLGLYEGVPATRRGVFYGIDDRPDVISIFQGPHERVYPPGRLAEEVRRTVIHEIGHYFGHDDDELRAMGY